MSQRIHTRLTAAALLASTLTLAACSWGYKPPAPTPLQANPAAVAAQVAWRGSVGNGATLPMQIAVQGDQAVVASANGRVEAFATSNGASIWSVQLDQPLSAGVGFDGTTAAVVTAKAELLAVRNGAVLWRVPLQNQSATAPLVAGGRVFVLGADHTVSAYDGNNGFMLWSQKSSLPANRLVLRQPGLLIPAYGALFAGVAGNVVGFNPDTGEALGDIPLASPRGVTDLSQVVDVQAPASRVGSSLCARAYQSTVGCINLSGGKLEWVQPHVGSSGIAGNEQIVVGADNNDVLTGWLRPNGQPAWKNETLKYRQLSAPLLVGNNVIAGDAQGYVHVLDASNGELRNRVRIDDSAIQVAPVLAGNTVIVVSSKGTVAGLRLQ